jgi:hypothetical protein
LDFTCKTQLPVTVDEIGSEGWHCGLALELPKAVDNFEDAGSDEAKDPPAASPAVDPMRDAPDRA